MRFLESLPKFVPFEGIIRINISQAHFKDMAVVGFKSSEPIQFL